MPHIDMWIYWVIAGIILVIAEIFTPGFVLALIGAASIITGVFAWFGFNSYVQLFVFGVSNLILFVYVRKIIAGTFRDKGDGPRTNYMALEGRKGKVVSKVSEHLHGEVKIGGEIWYAVPVDPEKSYENGSDVIVSKLEGNKVYVKGEE